MSEISNEIASEAQETLDEPVVEAKPQKTYYCLTVAKVGDTVFQKFNGKTIVQDADAAAPSNAVEWQPPPQIKNAVYYWYSGAWVHGLDYAKAQVSQVQASALKVAQIAFEKTMSTLHSEYSESERASWPQQFSDAQAVLTGGTASALLNTLASARGVDVKTLAQKIVTKSEEHASSYASALADFQVVRDKIGNAKKVTDIPSITVESLVRAYAVNRNAS
jgi:hypothetical protein